MDFCKTQGFNTNDMETGLMAWNLSSHLNTFHIHISQCLPSFMNPAGQFVPRWRSRAVLVYDLPPCVFAVCQVDTIDLFGVKHWSLLQVNFAQPSLWPHWSIVSRDINNEECHFLHGCWCSWYFLLLSMLIHNQYIVKYKDNIAFFDDKTIFYHTKIPCSFYEVNHN